MSAEVFPVYLRDSLDTALLAGATADDTPDMVPVLGYQAVVVFARAPLGSVTVKIQGMLRANSTAVDLPGSPVTVAAAASISQSFTVTGYEMIKIVVVNGDTGQSPEIEVSLIPLEEAA